MDKDAVVFTYTDAEAVRDGVLVNVLGTVPFPINRATRALFDHFTRPMGQGAITGLVTYVTRLSRLGDVVMERIRKGELQEGWVVMEDGGRTVWCVPNETTEFNHVTKSQVQGWTLMFPEDY